MIQFPHRDFAKTDIWGIQTFLGIQTFRATWLADWQPTINAEVKYDCACPYNQSVFFLAHPNYILMDPENFSPFGRKKNTPKILALRAKKYLKTLHLEV